MLLGSRAEYRPHPGQPVVMRFKPRSGGREITRLDRERCGDSLEWQRVEDLRTPRLGGWAPWPGILDQRPCRLRVTLEPGERPEYVVGDVPKESGRDAPGSGHAAQ